MELNKLATKNRKALESFLEKWSRRLSGNMGEDFKSLIEDAELIECKIGDLPEAEEVTVDFLEDCKHGTVSDELFDLISDIYRFNISEIRIECKSIVDLEKLTNFIENTDWIDSKFDNL